MLCRIPTAHWLDRLHARAKPTAPLPTPSTMPPPPPPPPAPAPPPPPPPAPASALPAILSDVFAVGPAAELPPATVRPRKQHRPRKKQHPEQPQRAQAPQAAPKKEASSSGKLKRKRKVKVVESGSADGSGGKTEATVIDTSTKGWKSAKVIFRKDGVWKVKEKKGPGALVQSNRRRLGGKIALERLREKRKEEEKKKNEEDGEKTDGSDQRDSGDADDDLQLHMQRSKSCELDSEREFNVQLGDTGKKRKVSLI